MSHSTVTRWTCTGCRVVVELPDRNQPDRWVRIWRVSPPLGSLSDCGMNWGDYCPECWGRVQAAMKGDSVPVVAP